MLILWLWVNSECFVRQHICFDRERCLQSSIGGLNIIRAQLNHFFFGHVEVGLLKLVKALHSVCDRLFYSLSHKHMHPHIFLGHNLDSDVTGKLPGVQWIICMPITFLNCFGDICVCICVCCLEFFQGNLYIHLVFLQINEAFRKCALM